MKLLLLVIMTRANAQTLIQNMMGDFAPNYQTQQLRIQNISPSPDFDNYLITNETGEQNRCFVTKIGNIKSVRCHP